MKLKKMYRSWIEKKGFVDETKKQIIERYIAWGYFVDEEGNRHKAAIPDEKKNIKHLTVYDAKIAIDACRASFI